jgi:hypothetical protein
MNEYAQLTRSRLVRLIADAEWLVNQPVSAITEAVGAMYTNQAQDALIEAYLALRGLEIDSGTKIKEVADE